MLLIDEAFRACIVCTSNTIRFVEDMKTSFRMESFKYKHYRRHTGDRVPYFDLKELFRFPQCFHSRQKITRKTIK